MLTACFEPAGFFLRCIIIRKTSNEREMLAPAELVQRGRRKSGFLQMSSLFLDSFPDDVVGRTY